MEGVLLQVIEKEWKINRINIEWPKSEGEPPPLLEEVREAVKDLMKGKSPEIDEITAELIKNGGPHVEAFHHYLYSKIWKE